ncbi:MAG: PASTA domain-containing protein [Bacteroidetes bacterium]|nr:MAG: PASTA domain-containing protein [Bacteroidota bacterium]
MNVKRDILWRVYVAFFAVALFGVMVVVYAVRIQFVEGEHWRKMAEELTTDYQTIEAVRGNIYAADGSLLATSVPIYELRMDFKAGGLSDEVFNVEVDSLAYHFAQMFKDKSQADYLREFKEARKKGSRYHLLKRKLSFSQVKEMRTWPILRRGQHKGGLIILEKDRRQKPFQLLAFRTIGYSQEGVAPVGLEGAYNTELAGVSGKRLMQKVAGGVWIPVNADNEIEPENGKDVYTTIDVNLQDVAENALYETLVKHDALNGCAILMEVETGHIKAIANLARKSEGVYGEEYNFAVGESEEPGSTIKLASLIALLEEGISLEDSVDVELGQTKFFDRTMKDSEPGHYQMLSLQQAFEKSSNVGISKLVYKQFKEQPQKFIDYFSQMGLDKPLNLQITGEGKPRIKNPKDNDWYGTTLPWMSIGYETQFTPLKILTLYNAIANQGRMVKPILVTEVRQTGKLVHKYETEDIAKSVCSKETLKKVRQALEGVVQNGTARNLKNDNYRIAGKTGTTQMARGGKYTKSFYKSSFAGYFPADNPKYACIVSINGASKGIYYGSAVAGPVFLEIANKVYASSLHMHKDISETAHTPEIATPRNFSGKLKDIRDVMNRLNIAHKVGEANEEIEWTTTARMERNMRLEQRKIIQNLVPNVSGMSLQDALFLLENRGLKVVVSGKGNVYRQSMNPGTAVYKGATIVIELR